jgi:enolase
VKFHQDGTFICPADTIADNLKAVEMAVEAAGLRDRVGVGIVWLADLFHNAE